jgi:RNA polymerase sigma-70 factor (ECF subfamily)
MLRDVEEMSTSETAAALNLTEENVKVRLHRGRALVRRDLFARVVAHLFKFLSESKSEKISL